METYSQVNEAKVRYPCQSCSASFTKEGFLRNHIRKRHLLELEQEGESVKKGDGIDELLGRGKRRKLSTGYLTSIKCVDESSNETVLELTKDDLVKKNNSEKLESQQSSSRRSVGRPRKIKVQISDAEQIKSLKTFSSSEAVTETHSSKIGINEGSNNSVTLPVKRKPGRPPKKKDLIDNIKNSKESEKLTGRKKILTASKITSHPEQCKNDTKEIKKRNNRQRQCNADNELKQSKRRRNEETKVLHLLNVKSTEQNSDCLLQKDDADNNIQSGQKKIENSSNMLRPRRSRSSSTPQYKEAEIGDNDNSEESEDEIKDEEVQPRKRGRHKKNSNGSSKMEVDEESSEPGQSDPKPRGRRGRKQRVVLEFNEFADEILCNKRGRPSNAMLQQLIKNSTSIGLNKIEKVTCSCLLEYSSLNEFRTHNLRSHYGLFRKLGDERPFSAYEKKLVLSEAIKIVKKLKCLNEFCRKSFSTVGGYLYHENICGLDKEQRMVTCELCGKILIESSMYAHNRAFHDETKIVMKVEEVDASHKRLAAQRAAEKLALIPKDLKVDKRDVLDADFEFVSEEENIDDLEIVEEKTEKVSRKTSVLIPHDEEFLKELWKKDLNFKGMAYCRNEGCNRKEEDLEKMFDHFVKCSHRQYDIYECKVCELRREKKDLVADHITSEHRELVKDNSSIDMDVLIKKFCCQAKPTSYRVDKRNRKAGQHFNSFLRNTFTQYITLAQKFAKNNFCNGIVFPDWLPFTFNWIEVPKNEKKLFLPKLKCSSEFKWQKSHTMSKEDSDWKKFKRFESTGSSNEHKFKMCFVGGPVKACAWCPTSLQTSCNQYLALYCHNDPDVKLTYKEICNNSCLIQIWNVGELELMDLSPGKLVLAIADKCGAIWDLTWCPSGCWNIGEDFDKNINSKAMPRIGLLSAACADGLVKIYSIPCPSSIKCDGEVPMYKVQPTAVLVLNPNIDSYPRVQCTTLSWFQGKGHDFIAGGYANGLIAVWHLTSKSPLIMTEQENGDRIIVSHLCFRGHGNIVTGIDFSHRFSGKYLVSCSRDRSVKFWNLENVSLPLNVIKNRSVNAIKWHPFWCGAFLGSDNCFSLNYNGMLFVDLDFFGELGGSAVNHHGSINDLSTSIWMKCIATCDEAGEVVLSVFSDIEKINLASNYKKLPLFCVSLKESEISGLEPDREKTSEDVNVLLKSVNKQFLYEETAKRFKIIYTDQSVNKPLPMSNPMMNCHPLHSVNKVVWNPNLGSHYWLASGDQFGMLRLYNVSSVDSIPVDKIRQNLKS